MTVEDDRIHSNQNPPCSHRDPTDWSYKKYDQYQSDEVKKRYREVPGKNTVTHQEECWVSLWKILFPNWNEALHGCIPTACKTPSSFMFSPCTATCVSIHDVYFCVR